MFSQMELDITFLANVAGETSHALHFARASEARKKAMEIVFWNTEKGQWFDYWLNDSSSGEVTLSSVHDSSTMSLTLLMF